MLRKSSSKRSDGISASITSHDRSIKKVYDPYEMTSFEEGTPKLKVNIPSGAPRKIKLTDSSQLKKKIKMNGDSSIIKQSPVRTTGGPSPVRI